MDDTEPERRVLYLTGEMREAKARSRIFNAYSELLFCLHVVPKPEDLSRAESFLSRLKPDFKHYCESFIDQPGYAGFVTDMQNRIARCETTIGSDREWLSKNGTPADASMAFEVYQPPRGTVLRLGYSTR